MKLSSTDRSKLLQLYSSTRDFDTRRNIIHKFVRDIFPNDKEYEQISSYIELVQRINKTMEGMNEHTRGIRIGNEYAILDIMKYF